jgi:multidrug resistance efflux pump
MNRQPALLDPRPSIPLPRPERPVRLIPWPYVWVGVLLLTASAVIAWLAVSPPANLSALMNVRSPAGAGTPGGEGNNGSLDRAVAIAYVEVDGGVAQFYPVRPGRVTKVHVKEGDSVKKDQKLLETDPTLALMQKAEAEVALKAAELGKKRAEQLVKEHKDGIESQKKKIAVVKSDVAIAKATLAKAKHFFKERLGGSQQDIDIAEAMLEKAKAGVAAEESELERISNRNPQLAVEAADLEIEAKERQLEKAKWDVGQYILRAPEDGKILRSFVRLGETLGTNPMRPAMQFAPDSAERIVRAEVEQEFASRVRVGMKAKIQDYDISNDEVWDGEVIRISDWIEKRRSQVFEPMQFNDVRTLEVIIRLKSQTKYPLRIGQRVRVTLER